eukprot:7190983-Prorocentrum_lima.AAC.1
MRNWKLLRLARSTRGSLRGGKRLRNGDTITQGLSNRHWLERRGDAAAASVTFTVPVPGEPVKYAEEK